MLIFMGMLLAGTLTVVGDDDLVVIGAPGNAADTNGRGAVVRPFQMGRLEVTNAEFLQLLNAAAKADPNGLFNFDIMTDSDRGGILQSGSPGSYVYTLKPNFADKPVNGVGWLDAARYCNWLHNGQPVGAQGPGTTEDGAFDLSLAHAAIVRKTGALFWLPSHDEWYKAAYHDPVDPGADAGGTPDYWLYPTSSDALPTKATADASGNVTNPGANVANFDKGAPWNGESSNVTTVGGTAANNPWGLLDIAGNIYELTDTPDVPIPANPPGQPDPLPTRTIRGGDFSNAGVLMSSPESFALALNMVAEAANIGFRLAAHQAWWDLGQGLGGTHGVPLLEGDGMLGPDSPITITLSGALENTTAFLVVGFTELNFSPFYGGVLVPDIGPPGFFVALPTNGSGGLVIAETWPAGLPSGFELYLQYWIEDLGGPFGKSASNAVRATTP
jgi:formylglycine-generating enzyme required for sulfatase activity